MNKSKELRIELQKYSKIMEKYMHKFNKQDNADLNYMFMKCCEYDNISEEEQLELQDIVIENADFFKFVNKCNILLNMIRYYNAEYDFNQKEMSKYNTLFSMVCDLRMSEKFKVALMKRCVVENTDIRI